MIRRISTKALQRAGSAAPGHNVAGSSYRVSQAERRIHASSATAEQAQKGAEKTGTRRSDRWVPSQRQSSLFDQSNTSHRIQYNVDPFTLTPSPEQYDFPLVSAAWLAKQTKRPRKVRMLARDFIHDALYNPQYGYFSRHAVLLPDAQKGNEANNAADGAAFDFSALSNERAFAVAVEERYMAFEEELDKKDQEEMKLKTEDVQRRIKETLGPILKKPSATPADESEPRKGKARTRFIPAVMPGSRESLEAAQRRGRLDLARELMNEKETGEHDRDVKAMAARQVWHTPTELFKPWYGFSIARYMIDNLPDDKPLRVYEVGAGSGALAKDILEYVRTNRPDLYETMQYSIIEISPRLAEQQRKTLGSHFEGALTKDGKPRVLIHNKSVLEWDKAESEPCFFLAMEVFDNLTHDVVRYSNDTLEPYQAIVSIDETGDMHELWEPLHDNVIKRYLSLLGEDQQRLPSPAPVWMKFVPGAVRRALVNSIPFYPNLTQPYYVPTGSLQLLDILANKFPRHRMVMSDFNALPDSLAGVNAPVVQTRLNGKMIAVTKYTVFQGFFDIFFPTNFPHLERLHAKVMQEAGAAGAGGQAEEPSPARIMTHKAFLQDYADVKKSTCRDGSNPMLSWYANASWFLS